MSPSDEEETVVELREESKLPKSGPVESKSTCQKRRKLDGVDVEATVGNGSGSSGSQEGRPFIDLEMPGCPG